MKLVTLIVFILVVFGLVMLASASSHLGIEKYGDSYYFLKHQIVYGLSVGLAGFLAAAFFPYRKLKKIALPLLIGNIILLALVFTPIGVTANNASRWLRIGSFRFQPSELLKITFIVYLAAWLASRSSRRRHFFAGLLPFIIVSGIIALLLFMQPATSTVAILLFTALAVYFASGAKLRYVVAAILFGIMTFAGVIYFTGGYRLNRIKNFLNPGADVLGGNYQLVQSQIAIGSGGIFGVGYGKSTTKITILPEPAGDSIFAVIGEELGFAGAILLIGLFTVLVVKTLLAARKTRDRFGSLLLVGFGTLIGIQVFTNIAAISGLTPLTGVPLPFISYGGTALAVFITISGIVVSVMRKRRRSPSF